MSHSRQPMKMQDLKCPLNLKGQYVKLQITKGYANVLHVAEVKVYGHK
jgi:hypothetical protein